METIGLGFVTFSLNIKSLSDPRINVFTGSQLQRPNQFSEVLLVISTNEPPHVIDEWHFSTTCPMASRSMSSFLMLTAQEFESVPPRMIITLHHLDEIDSIGQNLPLLAITSTRAGRVKIQHHITEWSLIGHFSERLQYIFHFVGNDCNNKFRIPN